MWLADLYTKGKGESSLFLHPDMSPSIHWLEYSKLLIFPTGEKRVTAVQINSTIIHTSVHNSIIIRYQYVLKSIDYIMFYSVTRILQMHFLHLDSFIFVPMNRPQWHKSPTSPKHSRLPISDWYCKHCSKSEIIYSGKSAANKWITNSVRCQH